MPCEACHVCQGRESIDSLLNLQLGGAPLSVPLCRRHFDACEGALAEVRRIQTPPVVINLAAVTCGAAPGQA